MSNPNGNGSNGDLTAPPELICDIERGLRFAHILMEDTQDEAIDLAARIDALAHVLIQKGIISKEELAAPLERAREQARENPRPRVRLHEAQDKYHDEHTADIDCASLIHLCRAHCCAFQFWLSKEDLDEGVARWDYGNPYWIRQEVDGYCTHYDRERHQCAIHAQRPHVCRLYDCRHDKRVWEDFENKIPADWDPTQGNVDVALEELVNWGAIKAAEQQLKENDTGE